MKKYVTIFLLISTLLIACSTNEATKSKPVTSDQKQEEKKTENIHKDAQPKEEVKETAYTVNKGNWALEPVNDQIEAKAVLLTIDDAPDQHALNMAQTLKELNVPAIFFVNGHFLETSEQKETLKEIYDLGFVIGNHTYSHRSLPDLSVEEQQEEIIKVNEQIEAILGEKPSFFRAPFGQNTDESKQIVQDEGMTLMNWTYGYDWNKEYMTKDAIAHIMVNAPELNNGANLLMHDRKWTSEALEEIVKGLQGKGYTFINPKTIEGYNKAK